MGQNDNETRPSRILSRQNQLEQLLQKITPEELQQFTLRTALHDRNLYEALLIHFADYLSNENPEQDRYRVRLYKILAKYTNQDGYISHKSAPGLASAITALLTTARRATTPTRESTDLCIAVIEVMPRIGEKMDDSSGRLYELMQLACTVLLECYESLKPELAQYYFDHVLSLYAEPEYLDLDLDSFLLILLKDWAKDDSERQSACLRQQESMLKASGDDKWRKNYLLEQTRELLDFWKHVE